MLGGFSSGLKLTNLDDFITPSQECIKPVQNEPRVKPNQKQKGKIAIESNDIDIQPEYEKATITLNDCLACSGCITSAEVILVNEQSTEQLLRVLDENEKCPEEEKLCVVLTLSVQALLSLGVKYELSLQDALDKVVGYFKKRGVKYVFDINIAACLSLIEAQQEFINRYKNRHDSGSSLPLLSSACPGWVCYAEKTQGSLLPHISQTRSPQQIMGVLVKDFWAKKMDINPDKIYHVSLMPCFDKKLEASREEFSVPDFNTREVDCVITSIEVEQMLEREEVDLKAVQPACLDLDLSISSHISTRAGSGSGGYAHHVFCYAAKELFEMEPNSLEWKTLRNNDMHEVVLERNGETLLRFGIANGFRNIQNLVQKIKRKKCPFDYVEIMACPSGCLNGGAQVRPTTGKTSKELIQHLESLYGELPKISPEESSVANMYSEWFSHESKAKLHTSYKEVEKNVNPLGIKW